MIVDHRWLVAAEDRMGLRARSQAELDGATGRRSRRYGTFPLCSSRACPREDARKLHMIALQHQDRVGEKEIDQGGIPHQVPARFRLGLEALELPAREGKAVVGSERLEVGDVAVQDRAERFPMQEADVVALMKGIDQ
jgi:hypothetical protein